MPRRTKFTAREEKKIIDFVRSHEMLYNMKHSEFRNSEGKHRLWMRLANELVMDVDKVKKKWQTMRDYFVRTRDGKRNDTATSKRDKALSFLLNLNSPSISSLPISDPLLSDQETQSEFVSVSNVDSKSNADELPIFGGQFEFGSASSSSIPKEKKRRALNMSGSDTNEVLKEFMTQRPKPSEKPSDDIQQFFDSMASTVRKFSPLTIAQIKLKIAQIVGEEEIAWAEKTTAAIQEQRTNRKKHE